jgi:hypothetical protein
MIRGRAQVGFRTMSSKVAFGEKSTPISLPTGEIDACASGTAAGIVAIEDSLLKGIEVR